jgi:hypothetical protein
MTQEPSWILDLKAQLGPEGRAKLYERMAERLNPDGSNTVGDVWTDEEIWQVLTEILEAKRH